MLKRYHKSLVMEQLVKLRLEESVVNTSFRVFLIQQDGKVVIRQVISAGRDGRQMWSLQSIFYGKTNQFCCFRNVQFLKNILAVGFNGVMADPEFLGNFITCKPLSDQLDDLLFPSRQNVDVLLVFHSAVLPDQLLHLFFSMCSVREIN